MVNHETANWQLSKQWQLFSTIWHFINNRRCRMSKMSLNWVLQLPTVQSTLDTSTEVSKPMPALASKPARDISRKVTAIIFACGKSKRRCTTLLPSSWYQILLLDNRAAIFPMLARNESWTHKISSKDNGSFKRRAFSENQLHLYWQLNSLQPWENTHKKLTMHKLT